MTLESPKPRSGLAKTDLSSATVGHLEKVPENYPLLWEKFQQEHQELADLLKRVRVSFVVRLHEDNRFDVRAGHSLSSLLAKRYGFGTDRRSIPALAEELGLSSVSSLIQGTLAYIARETGLPFNPRTGIMAKAHEQAVRKRVDEQRIFERIDLDQATAMEQQAIRMYLLGVRNTDIANHLVAGFGLPADSIKTSTVNNLINNLLRRVDRRAVLYTSEKALKARTLLEAEPHGKYRNLKAEATLNILSLIADGYKQSEIIEETGLRAVEHQALVHEAYTDLLEDLIGREDLANIYRQFSKMPFEPLYTKTQNMVYQSLYDPYRSFRLRLGDAEDPSNNLTTIRLSPRERSILADMSREVSGRTTIRRLSINGIYYAVVSRALLGETGFISRQNRLIERSTILTRLLEDIHRGKTIPKDVAHLSGVSVISIFEHLASGGTYDNVIKMIFNETGRSVTQGQLLRFCGIVRAYYQIKTHTM